MRFFLSAAFSISMLTLAGPKALAGDIAVPAIYTVGNLDEFSAGAEGELTLKETTLTFSDKNNVVFAPYTQIRSAELGDKAPPAPASKLRKVLKVKKQSAARMLTIEFKDSGAQADRAEGAMRAMTFQVEELAGIDIVEIIEERNGKHPRTKTGDSWWGDSAWKTKRNGNSVKEDSLGRLEK